MVELPGAADGEFVERIAWSTIGDDPELHISVGVLPERHEEFSGGGSVTVSAVNGEIVQATRPQSPGESAATAGAS